MSAGFSTRVKLHAANQSANQSDDTYGFSTPRLGATVMGYGEREEFALPDRSFMPNFAPYSLGTPGEARRDREARIEATWAKTFAICAALIAALVAIWRINAPASNQPRPADIRIEYSSKVARLKPGESLHFLNDQGCLVFLHKEIVGPIMVSIVSDHC